MELTLENLMLFLEKEYPYDIGFKPQTELRHCKAYIDGIDAVDLLKNLSKEFNVTFENFDFHEYFLAESELNTMTWKHLFGLKRQRDIEKELTIEMLFDYMNKNKNI
jgi:hypothetical protein